MSDDDWGWAKATRSWVLGPCDHLMMRMQYLDDAGNGIFDFIREKNSPLREFHDSMTAMLGEPVREGPLKTVFRQYEFAGEEVLNNITNDARHLIVNIDAQA
jgi:hypothetical protein